MHEVKHTHMYVLAQKDRVIQCRKTKKKGGATQIHLALR